MPAHYDSEDDRHEQADGDREISLGTGTVLAIFLALALVCSLFFGLGYSMGRKSAPTAAALGVPSGTDGGDKTSPSNRMPTRAATTEDALSSDQQVAQPVVKLDTSGAALDGTPVSAKSAHDRSATAGTTKSSAGVASSAQENILPPTAPGTAASTYVQVAAVSRKEDADLLLAALKRRGYVGIVRQQSQDNLRHIQVGPFATKKEAEAMRQRLIVDGYNPIIK